MIDEFLDDATHGVANRWYEAGQAELSYEEKVEINDWLTQFFSTRR